METSTRLLEKVNFTSNKVDVSAAVANQVLLDGYLGLRALSPSSVEGYTSAVASFTRYTGLSLEAAGELDLETWYREARGGGLMASSTVVYAVYLEELLRYAMRRRGLGARAAEARAGAIMDGVPMRDLRREIRRRTEFREMLILRDEEEALMEAAAWPRTRALMAVSRDSACRKGELITARLRDVTHRDGYSELRVHGKTGERTMPLVRSVPALTEWLDAHPRPRPGAPLFATVWRGRVGWMDESAPNKLMDRICIRAGVRHVRPHMWRHTRLTEWARAGVGEYMLKSLAGWTPDSRMAAKYIHLSGRDHIPAVLRLEGVESGVDEGTRKALDAAVELMASDDTETRVFALKAFMRLNGHSNMQTRLGGWAR